MVDSNKCVVWPHKWIDITTNGGPPTAMCTRCNEQRPIVCAPDECQTWSDHTWVPYEDNYQNVWRECSRCGAPEGVLIKSASDKSRASS